MSAIKLRLPAGYSNTYHLSTGAVIHPVDGEVEVEEYSQEHRDMLVHIKNLEEKGAQEIPVLTEEVLSEEVPGSFEADLGDPEAV